MRWNVYLKRIIGSLLNICFLAILFISCDFFPFHNVTCREFAYHDALKWYPGYIGDTITFVKQDHTKVDFIIKKKYIYHITDYTSDSGCGCYDCYGMTIMHAKDTIDMFGEASYVNDNDAIRGSYIYAKVDGNMSGFITEDASKISSYTIDSITFTNVLRYKYSHSESSKFKEIYFAENIGIIKMVRNNGEIWINNNLTQKLNTDFDTFSYNEEKCE